MRGISRKFLAVSSGKIPVDEAGNIPHFAGMALTDDLLSVLRTYCEARKIALPTLSTRILNDGRALSKVAAGTGTLTMRNYDRCMVWLSTNWPDGVAWPAGVARPTPQQAEDAA